MNGTSALRFSAGGRKLVSFGADFFVRTTDLSNGKALLEFSIRAEGLDSPGNRRSFGDELAIFSAVSAVLTADGSQLCIQGGSKRNLFNTNTGKEVVSLDLGPDFGAARPVFSPDGAQILIVGRGKPIETPIKGGGTRHDEAKEKPLVCWDAKTGQKRWEATLLAGWLNCLAYAPDGRTFAVQSRDSDKVNPVEFRDAATGNVLGRMDKLPTNTHDVEFTPDGKRIVLTMVDGTVLLYNVPDFKK
jgi:WD40 repeat protein